MKNKKLSILFESMRKIDQYRTKNLQAPQEGSTKINFEYAQTTVTATAFQISLFQKNFPTISLHDMAQDFSQYMALPSQILGKRSSKIVLSKSNKYCLKAIQQDDIAKIEQILPDLLPRFNKNDKKNCLINIYFIFIVEYTLAGVKVTDRFIIMPNVRANFDNCIRTFDIKGHLQARSIDQDDFIDFKFGKDENFVQSEELRTIKDKISQQIRVKIVQDIQENIQFLAKNNIIDYSLLICIEKYQENQTSDFQSCQTIQIDQNTILKWVIIDYFQIYNDKKKIENKFKSIFRKTISSVEPSVYSQRLIQFLKKYLLG